MSCLIPKSDDNKLPKSPKKGWKHLLRIFKFFKNSDDYHNHYYQYHVHFDDYKKRQRHGSGAMKSSPIVATTVHEQTAAAAARAFTTTRERARVHHCSKDGHRNQNTSRDDDENGEGVDADCEEFIERFRDSLKLERLISAEKEFRDMLDRSA